MSLNGAILGMSAYRRFAVSSSTLISTSVNISNCRCSTSLQHCKSPFVVSTRAVSSGGFPFKTKLFFNCHNVWRCSRSLSSSQPSQKRLLEEPDETSPHVIYKGLLSDQMKRLKIFSLTTSGMGLLMQPILIEKSSQVSVGANVAVFGMVGFFTFVTPFLIHAIAKKYVTEIIYDPAKDQYKATAFTFFLRKNQIPFTIDNIHAPDVPGPFSTLIVTAEGNKKIPIFVAPESFLKPSHYGRFMGFDKPLDLRLTNKENSNKNKN